MIELEDRLRTALATLADEVPPSRNARAELERRLLARRRATRHRPVLAAAAAAVVIVAGVGTPFLLGNTGQQTAPVAPTSTAPTSRSSSMPGAPALATAGPFRLATFAEGGREWGAWAYVNRVHGPAGVFIDFMCVVGVPEGQALDGPTMHPNSAGCTATHDRWPADQPRPKVETMAVLGGTTLDSGPLPGLLLFVTVADVRTLEARAHDRTAVPVRELGRTDRLALFLADFGDSTQGFGYTARDGTGKVVEQAIS